MSTPIFEDKNLPTRLLGELFLSRADDLTSCGRHPMLRLVAAHKRIYGEPVGDIDENSFAGPAKQALISWMQQIYTSQLGTALRSGLALAAEAKMRLMLLSDEQENKEVNAALSSAAETFFASSSVLQPIVSFFGAETDWPLIAESLFDDALSRFSKEYLADFDYPDGDDPNCPAEGPTVNGLREALGLSASDNEDEHEHQKNPPSALTSLAEKFPGISYRLKPSNN